MKKKLCLILAGLMCIATMSLSGCGEKEDTEGGVLTLTYFDKNITDQFGVDEISQKITEKTGVTLQVDPVTGSYTEKMNIMLASNAYPDLLLIPRSVGLIEKFINASAIIPLDDLIAEHAPNVTEQYGDMLKKARFTDGKLYGLPNWFGMDDEVTLSFMFRRDLLREVAPAEKANADTYITSSEMLEYLKAFKEKYPTINGRETIAMTFNADNFTGAAVNTFKAMYGMKSFYEADGKLYYDWRDPKYLEMLKYMNNLYTEGLLDPEWANNKQQLYEQKASGGYVFSCPDAYWNLSNVNVILGEQSPDARFMAYKVVADGVAPDQTTYSGRNPLGWDVLAISKTNKHPEETMKFIDFMASEEGQYLVMSGIEGKHYDVVDGKRVPKPEVVQEMQTNPNYVKESGVRKWTMTVKNGVAKDGNLYDLILKQNRSEDDLFARKTLTDSVWDTSPYDDLYPLPGTTEALISQKVSDKTLESVSKMLFASSEAELEQMYQQFVAEVEEIGAAQVEEVFNSTYQARMKLWE